MTSTADFADTRLEALRVALEALDAQFVADRAHLLTMQALARTATSLQRDHYEPGHFTASAFVVCPEGRNLLLIRHAKLQMWLQPGGHIEAQDTSTHAAALREAVEETGIAELETVCELFDIDVHEIPAWKDTPRHLHHDLRALLRAKNRELQVGDDVADARWFSLREVASCGATLYDGVGTDHSVRRVAAALLDGPHALLLKGATH